MQQIQFLIDAMTANYHYALGFVGIFILVFMVNRILLGGMLNIFGIYPRHPFGLIGIFCNPFLHADFNHLFFNMIPLFILSSFLLIYGLQYFIYLTFLIILVSGVLLWLFGRPAIHIGASSLVMGYMGVVLTQAYLEPNTTTILVLFVCLYYLGGLLLSIFPTAERISWEGHLFGLLSGGIAFYLMTIM